MKIPKMQRCKERTPLYPANFHAGWPHLASSGQDVKGKMCRSAQKGRFSPRRGPCAGFFSQGVRASRTLRGLAGHGAGGEKERHLSTDESPGLRGCRWWGLRGAQGRFLLQVGASGPFRREKGLSQGRGRVVPSPSSGRRAHAGGLAFSVSSALAAGRGGLQAQGRCCSSARGSGRAQGPRGF